MSIDDILASLEEVDRIAKVEKLSLFTPYPKQLAYIALGGAFRERALFANNRGGKTLTNCSECAIHLTGRYPSWWPKTAKRFNHPVEFIVAGKTALSTRDILQKMLLGPPGTQANLGTGLIPKEDIVVESAKASHGAGGGIDVIEVRNRWSKTVHSRIYFRTYAMGPDLFEGVEMNGGVIFDEEPGQDVYDEALMRIATTNGYMAVGFTPLKGRTPVVKRFLDERSPDRAHVIMSLDDAEHFTPERREQMKRGTLPHMYNARILGIPGGTESAIFPIDPETIKRTYEPLDRLPREWYYLWAIDPGLGHPFGAVLLGYDRDGDCIHVLRAIRVAGQTPLQHAFALRQIAPNVRVAWPKDTGNREKGTGTPLKNLYSDHMLDMLPSHVTNPDGSVGLEWGLLNMWERMTTGRFKVNAQLVDWFAELRDYHKDDNGNVVAVDDDLMSATRYGCMAIKQAGTQNALGGGQTWLEQRAAENRRNNTDEAIRARGGEPDLWGA